MEHELVEREKLKKKRKKKNSSQKVSRAGSGFGLTQRHRFTSVGHSRRFGQMFFRFGSVAGLDISPGTVDGPFSLLAVTLWSRFDETAIVPSVVVLFRLDGRPANF